MVLSYAIGSILGGDLGIFLDFPNSHSTGQPVHHDFKNYLVNASKCCAGHWWFFSTDAIWSSGCLRQVQAYVANCVLTLISATATPSHSTLKCSLLLLLLCSEYDLCLFFFSFSQEFWLSSRFSFWLFIDVNPLWMMEEYSTNRCHPIH